jgi:hypothetical protein
MVTHLLNKDIMARHLQDLLRDNTEHRRSTSNTAHLVSDGFSMDTQQIHD